MPKDPKLTAKPAMSIEQTWQDSVAHKSLCEFIPASSLVTPSDCITVGGEFFRSYRLDGIAFETTEPQYIQACHEALCSGLRLIGGGHFALWMHRARRRTTEELHPIAGNDFAAQFDRRYSANVTARPFLCTEIYLTLVYRPTPTKLGRLFRGNAATAAEVAAAHDDALRELSEKGTALERALREFEPRLLGERVGRNGKRYSELAEFLGFLVNGAWSAVRAPVLGPLYKLLPIVRASFSRSTNTGELRTVDGARYIALLDIKEYSNEVEPGCLNDLLLFDCEFIESMSFSILNRSSALSWLDKQRKQLVASQDVVESQIVAMDAAKENVGAGDVLLGEFSYSLAVFGDTARNAALTAARAAGAVGESTGIGMVPIDLVPHAAWFAQLPTNYKYRTREARITSHAFAALGSCHSYVHGKRFGNPWGHPVLLLRTASNEPYYFNFHASPRDLDATDDKLPGNTLVLGTTGSGKTTFALGALTGTQRCDPAPRMLLFDYGRGMEIWVRAMRGQYYVAEAGKPTGFNPFQREPTPARQAMWAALLAKMLENASLPLLPSDEEAIAHAVKQLANMPHAQRTVSVLQQFLPRDKENSLYDRLARWTKSGELGWVFDMAPERMPNLADAHIVGIDYTELLDHKLVTPCVMLYLLDMLDEMCDGRRFIASIAEFWRALGDPIFTDLIKNKLKVIRKQNGLVILDSQSPSDALSSSIGRTVAEQCVTKVLLYNEAPLRSQYVEELNCSAAEYEIVAGFQKGGRSFLVKQGDRSAVVAFDLGGKHDELLVLSATDDNVKLLAEIRQQVGDEPAAWLPRLRGATQKRRATLQGATS